MIDAHPRIRGAGDVVHVRWAVHGLNVCTAKTTDGRYWEAGRYCPDDWSPRGAARAATAAATTGAATARAAALATPAAALSRTRRTCRFQRLLLVGRQDLVELGLRLLFQVGNLLLLVIGEFQLLQRETLDQMEAATGTAAATLDMSAASATALTAGRRTLLVCLLASQRQQSP